MTTTGSSHHHADPLRFQRLLDDLQDAHRKTQAADHRDVARKFPGVWQDAHEAAFQALLQVQLELLVQDVFGLDAAARLKQFLDARVGALPANVPAAYSAPATRPITGTPHLELDTTSPWPLPSPAA